MPENIVLTNFNVTESIRKRFDEICFLTGKTRTAALVELMEHFIRSEAARLSKRNSEIERIDETLRDSRRLLSFRGFLRERYDTP